jgi:triacylglycerol esterase/lipase EstA (alpha/beta hydrolase family)
MGTLVPGGGRVVARAGAGIAPRARALALLGALTCVALSATTAAAHAEYAPLNQRGPKLEVPGKVLRAALRCTPDVATNPREPILLVPGTTMTPEINFSWNYERALSALALPYCTVELPDKAMGDIQVAAEYVVYALRAMAKFEGKAKARKVQIIGYSQGGMVPRWALRFWPDTRKLVDDDVGLDASNHGTVTADPDCLEACAPAVWQQRDISAFTAALNSYTETFPGISYTEIYSQNDEIVVPNLNEQGSSSVHSGGGTIANIAVQEICPGHVADHLAMGSYDPVGYALALDAVTHAGPAQASRIGLTVCAEAFQPGVDPSTFAEDDAMYDQTAAETFATYPRVPSEPPLKCYVTASCAS